MPKFVNLKRGIETVGQLRAALAEFPDDFPIEAGWGTGMEVMVGQVDPSRPSACGDPRGYVFVTEDDGSDDD